MMIPMIRGWEREGGGLGGKRVRRDTVPYQYR